MASEAAVERDEKSAARQVVFGRWTEGVSPNVVISVAGLILATLLGGILAGIFMILDSQFELLHRRLDAQDRKLDEALGAQDRKLDEALDAQDKKLDEALGAQDRKLDEALGKLATKDDLRNIERRLLGIEEYLRGGGGSGGQRE